MSNLVLLSILAGCKPVTKPNQSVLREGKNKQGPAAESCDPNVQAQEAAAAQAMDDLVKLTASINVAMIAVGFGPTATLANLTVSIPASESDVVTQNQPAAALMLQDGQDGPQTAGQSTDGGNLALRLLTTILIVRTKTA